MTQQDFQRKLNQLMPDYRKKFDEQQKKFFETSIYDGPMPERMLMYRQLTLMHVNEAKLNVSTRYWAQLFGADVEKFSLNDIATILSCADELTFKDWCQALGVAQAENMTMGDRLKEWIEFRNFITACSNHVNPIIEKFSAELLDKLLRTQTLDVSGQSKSIPLAHRRDNPLVPDHLK